MQDQTVERKCYGCDGTGMATDGDGQQVTCLLCEGTGVLNKERIAQLIAYMILNDNKED